MKVPCEIDTYKGLKKGGMKIVFYVKRENTRDILENLPNFQDMPLLLDIRVDAEEQKDRLGRISPEARKKIYAIFRDFGNHMGDDAESVKVQMKTEFVRNSQHEMFSLADCESGLASDFIEFLIRYAFEYGIPLQESPREAFGDDIERYIRLCNEKKICAICGRPGEIHHVDTIGMGRDRRTVDDSQYRKICLCREHHTEAHARGWDRFSEKYHVVGVI
jgi:isopropylmalate/homocitrate/citramalate synthase